MTSTTTPVIAGFNAGIKVTIRADLYPTFQNMQQLAVQGNHWARLSVAYIKSLSANQFKNNVFVQDNGRLEQYAEYTIILPGCRASFHKNDKGEFFIYALEADANYSDLQQAQKKPGLYKVKKADGEWAAELLEDGRIKEGKINIVAISDQTVNVEHAANSAADAIGDSGQATSRQVASNGFDLHFTPGTKRIGGLRSIQQAHNPESDPSLHESALLLARSMAYAKSIKDLTWVSEGGGSGVVTQAMQILKDRGVSFEGSKQVVFFSGLTTNLVKAEKLARDIGLSLERKTHSKDLLNIHQLFGSGFASGYTALYNRYKIDEKYTALKFANDVAKETSSHKAALGVVGISSAAVTTALATPSVGILSAAIVFAAAVIPVASKVVSGGDAVMKAYFPRQHKKIKDKF